MSILYKYIAMTLLPRNLALFSLILSSPALAQQPAPRPASEPKTASATAPAAPPTVPPDQQKLDVSRHQRLAEAAAIGLKWQDHVKAGTLEKGTDLWGYQAFDRVTKEQTLARFTTPPLGKLAYTALLEDRCAIDPDGLATGQPGTYITLRFFSEYESGPRRETLTLHEPVKGGSGLKVIALKRQVIPSGSQGMFDFAANMGQVCLLKLHAAPKWRYEPLLREAKALASLLNITLPEIPEQTKENDEVFGEKLVKLILEQTPELIATVPRPTSAPPSFESALPAAKAILHAYALMLLYTPGEETASRLAVIAATEAEKAKLPRPFYKPMVEQVHKKATLPEVQETVLTMASDISSLLEDAETAFTAAQAPSEVMAAALKNMESLPTYEALARFTAQDGRISTIQAVLAPGVIDLMLTGFDQAKQFRNASKDGFFVSTDEGKTWQREDKQETTEGLCRSVQAPLTGNVHKNYLFFFRGIESVEGEALYRFSTEVPDEKSQPRDYWILLSGKGAVIRQARMPMKFGDLETDALFRYTKLGKEVQPLSPPAAAPKTTPSRQ